MSMRLFIGGMRGSQPATGAAFATFGGDTTSLLVLDSQGERIVLDAGTGLHAVARELATEPPGEVTVLFSHYHLDHMIGLTMNRLFYQSDWSFRLVGPTFADGGVRDAVTRVLAPPYWPVPWNQMGAKFEFAEFTTEESHVGTCRVRGCPVPHPGGSLAYRIDDTGGTAMVYATDMEWRDRTAEQERAFITLCTEPKPADVLVVDAHFAEADATAFAGWGHTCWEDGLKIAESAGIPRVFLGHHAPDADDETLLAVEQRVQARRSGTVLARAGQWLTVGG